MRTILIIAGTLVIAFLVWYFFFKKPVPTIVRDKVHTDDYTITFGGTKFQYSIGDAPRSIYSGKWKMSIYTSNANQMEYNIS